MMVVMKGEHHMFYRRRMRQRIANLPSATRRVNCSRLAWIGSLIKLGEPV